MKPILFFTPMVQAIQFGRKTMTRRVTALQDSLSTGYSYTGFVLDTTADKNNIGCFRFDHEKYLPIFIRPRYSVGDVLWVRETWGNYSYDNPESNAVYFMYRADYPADAKGYWYEPEQINWCNFPCWRSPRFMPREAARIFLRVTNVRVERVCEISEEDALKEGVLIPSPDYERYDARALFEYLWDKKNVKRGYGWETNPWVWVYEFEKISKEEALRLEGEQDG